MFGVACVASQVEVIIYRLPLHFIGRSYLPSLEKGD